MSNIYPIGEYHNSIFEKESDISSNLGGPSGDFYMGDVQDALHKIKDLYRSKIQLIYMDPPFMTGQSFRYRQKIGDKGMLDQVAYRDRWTEGRGEYLDFMRKAFEHAYHLLTPEGSFYLHVDYRTSAYLRVILDEIFGEDNFLNEIIWHYKSGGRAKKHFSRKHDTILFYRKSPKHYFNIEAVGIKRGNRKRNNMKREVDEDGKVFWSIRSGGKIYKYYEDSKVYPSDVWTDISHLHQRHPERTGYDTQKPEALLKRIILSSSRPGDYVADFFAGSGTTLAVARNLKRSWIGLDSSIHSMNVCRKRFLTQDDNSVFAIHYDNDKKILFKPEISLQFEEESNSQISITLLDYLPSEDMKSLYKNDKDIGLDGLEHIDYWAVGWVEDHIFYPKKFAIKDNTGSIITNSIRMHKYIGKEIVVHVVDVWGNQFFRVIMNEAKNLCFFL